MTAKAQTCVACRGSRKMGRLRDDGQVVACPCMSCYGTGELGGAAFQEAREAANRKDGPKKPAQDWLEPGERKVADRMKKDASNVLELVKDVIMGKVDLVKEIDKHHGTNLGEIRDAARQKAEGFARANPETAGALRSMLAGSEPPKWNPNESPESDGPEGLVRRDCAPCRGMGATMMQPIAGGPMRPAVCQVCRGTGRAGSVCEACSGHGAVIESASGRAVPKPCRACNATGKV